MTPHIPFPTFRIALSAVIAGLLALPVGAQQKSTAVQRVPAGKNVELEIVPDGPRRVRVAGQVVFREGLLELFMCKKNSKEHESIVAADVDARDIHKALLAAGAKAISPAKFEPKYSPAKGSTIKVSVEYVKDGKTVIVPARQWVREVKTKKELGKDWVFGGSQFFPDPDSPKNPPLYAANGGDLICVSNFPTAMLDLPVESTQVDADLQFEAFTDRIPPLGTKVTVILEPVPEKK